MLIKPESIGEWLKIFKIPHAQKYLHEKQIVDIQRYLCVRN